VTKDDFELLTVIGKGSFGKVMQVKKKDTGEIYAMKVLRKEAIIARKQVAHTRAEKSILQKIQHPFIVRLHFAFQTKDKLYMILDYINGGELFYHLKKEGRFPEERGRFAQFENGGGTSSFQSNQMSVLLCSS
jgi:serine/threonine protein kinase